MAAPAFRCLSDFGFYKNRRSSKTGGKQQLSLYQTPFHQLLQESVSCLLSSQPSLAPPLPVWGLFLSLRVAVSDKTREKAAKNKSRRQKQKNLAIPVQQSIDSLTTHHHSYTCHRITKQPPAWRIAQFLRCTTRAPRLSKRRLLQVEEEEEEERGRMCSPVLILTTTTTSTATYAVVAATVVVMAVTVWRLPPKLLPLNSNSNIEQPEVGLRRLSCQSIIPTEAATTE